MVEVDPNKKEEFNTESDECSNKLKKSLMLIIGIFLLVLIISYTLFTSDAFYGLISSKTIKNNALCSKNITIVFLNNTLKLLQEHYTKNNYREIKACLYGKKEFSKYFIDRIFFPEILSASVVHVKSVSCPNALIDLHSHPINHCLASKKDVENFKELKAVNPDILMVIMCSKNRFAVYE